MSDDTAATPERSSALESRLRHALAAKATAGPVREADWGDLAGRLASTTRRRQRVLVGAAGVALLAGAAGGYFGEAAASPGPLSARAPGSGSSPVRGGLSPGTNRTASPSISGPAAPQICQGAETGTSGTDLGTATRVFSRTTGDGVTIRVYQMPNSGASCIGSPKPLAGSGGTSSPSHSSSGSSGSGSSSGSVSPSGSVSSSGGGSSSGSSIRPVLPASPEVTVELSDDDAVGQGVIVAPQCIAQPGLGTTGTTGGSGATGGSGGSVVPPVASAPVETLPPTPAPLPPPSPTTTPPTKTTTPSTPPPTATTTPPSELRQLTTGTFGVLEGHPVWWVGVEVGTTVTSVRMTFADGSTDQMAAVGGIAVLASRVTAAVASADPGPYVVRGTLELLDSAGNVVTTVTLPEQPVPVPGPAPVPLQGPVVQGPQASAPGAISVCPQAVKGAASAQSSTTTEKR